jgi:hypothetical protein
MTIWGFLRDGDDQFSDRSHPHFLVMMQGAANLCRGLRSRCNFLEFAEVRGDEMKLQPPFSGEFPWFN